MSRLALTSVEPGFHTEEEGELSSGEEGYVQEPWDENRGGKLQVISRENKARDFSFV